MTERTLISALLGAAGGGLGALIAHFSGVTSLPDAKPHISLGIAGGIAIAIALDHFMKTRKLPVENPARIARFREAVAALTWERENYRPSVTVLFNELSELVDAEIQYYYSRRGSSRKLSWWCRVLAWLLSAIGILVPLVHPILGTSAPATFLSWGYLAFGMAGLVFLLNTLFAGSQAHHRYTKTQLQLEHLFEAFSLRWQRGLVELDANPTAERVQSQIDEARAFLESIHGALASETSEWKRDVDEGLSQMKAKMNGGTGDQ